MWGLTNPGETLPPGDSQFLENTKELAFEGTFYMQTNQYKAHSLRLPLISSIKLFQALPFQANIPLPYSLQGQVSDH